jgi:raffinose synthase
MDVPTTLETQQPEPIAIPHLDDRRSTTHEWLSFDDDSYWVSDSSDNAPSGFICSKRALTQPLEKLGLVTPRDAKRWTAIGTFNDPYWNRVKQGSAWEDVPAQTQFLLWEREAGGYGILLPMLSGDHVSSLQGDKGGVRLFAASGHINNSEEQRVLAYSAIGADIYTLVNRSIQAIVTLSKSFRLRTQKKMPAFVDHLGWCSWDAFYSKVNERKFMSAMNSFEKGGLKPGFVILDDGWLENRGDLLCSFGPNREKFPNGIDLLTRKVKERYGIKFFGIWHTLTGYWGGIDPNGELSKRFALLKSNGTIRPWEEVKKKEWLYLVDPQEAGRFFVEFHEMLKSSGIDLVKVDGQSALSEFSRPHCGRVSAMRAYQQAIQSSVERHFDGGMIHCMSNGLDVAYHLDKTVVWRNSDDFFPKRSSSWQQIHVHTNAINSLWTGTFALPDWDMFQSHHRYAEFHAASRALSGGPVYVCDKPGRQNFEILNRLASEDGQVRRCDRPALPAPESIFADCRKESVLLKIHNRSGNVGYIGFFHCSEVRKRLRGTFSPADIPDLKGTQFIARHHTTGQIEEMNVDDTSSVLLPRMGYEIITLAPVFGGWLAPLGRAERYVGATALSAVSETGPDSYQVALKESGSYLFWCNQPPLVVVEGGEAVLSKYHAASRMLTIKAKSAVTITLSPLVV